MYSPPPPDDRYRVETPEQIGLEYDIAGLGTRFLATLVDMIFLSLILFTIGCLGVFGLAAAANLIDEALLDSDGEAIMAIVFAVMALLTFAILWGYYVFFETIWNGQSPGKRWTGLRVIQEGGYPIRFSHAAIRNIVRIADFLPFMYVIGAVVMLVDRRSRRLGDLVAGTIVVKELPEVAAGTIGGAIAHIPTASMPAMQGIIVSDGEQIPNLHRVTAADQSLIREYFMRRSEFLPEASAALSLKLANAFARKLEYTPTGDVPDQFLARIARQLGEQRQPPPSPSSHAPGAPNR
ncbi:MAG TPA: RDD family protein [Thermomicrobiales bacterium]|nr:RDD family protein [Thermomicrobiales bacterium]